MRLHLLLLPPQHEPGCGRPRDLGQLGRGRLQLPLLRLGPAPRDPGRRGHVRLHAVELAQRRDDQAAAGVPVRLRPPRREDRPHLDGVVGAALHEAGQGRRGKSRHQELGEEGGGLLGRPLRAGRPLPGDDRPPRRADRHRLRRAPRPRLGPAPRRRQGPPPRRVAVLLRLPRERVPSLRPPDRALIRRGHDRGDDGDRDHGALYPRRRDVACRGGRAPCRARARRPGADPGDRLRRRAWPRAARRGGDPELAEVADQQRHHQLVVTGEVGVRRPGGLRRGSGLHDLPALPPLLEAADREGPGTPELPPDGGQ